MPATQQTEPKWKWIAQYDDGSFIKQYDRDTVHKLADVKQDGLALFTLHQDHKFVTLNMQKGDKPILFIRHHRSVDIKGDWRYEDIYCVGYQRGSEKHIEMIYPNDIVVTTNDANAVLGVRRL